jgi:hypothetical protein
MTTRPGTGLRRTAARLLPPATVERFVDPAVADLQHEYTEALARSRWRARAIRVAGSLGLLPVIALLSGQYALQRGWERLCHPNRPAVAITGTAMAVMGSLTSIIAIAMTIAIAMMATRYGAYPGAELQISAFSLLSVFEAGGLQFGFALALLITIARTPARRLKVAAILTMIVVFSATSVWMMSVTLPSPRALSRTAPVDRSLTDTRSAPGVTSAELQRFAVDSAGNRNAPRRAFIRPDDARSMLFAYGTRIAAGVSPLLFCLFALTLARRFRIAVAFPMAVSAWAAYLVWFTWLRQPLIASSLPIRLAVWGPDVAIVLSTLLLAFAYTARTDPNPAGAWPPSRA